MNGKTITFHRHEWNEKKTKAKTIQSEQKNFTKKKNRTTKRARTDDDEYTTYDNTYKNTHEHTKQKILNTDKCKQVINICD